MQRCVFVQRPVSSGSVVVVSIGTQESAQMRLAKDNDVIQTFSANGPDQSFGKSVLPWRARCDRFVSNAHGPEALSYD